MKYSAEQIKDILKNAPNGSQFYTDGYDVKYRKVIGDKYFGYLDEAKGWVETCDKQLSQERIDKGWWLANLIKELENQMNIDKLATRTPEEKEALDLINTTPHQYEVSKFSGKAEWKNGDDVEAYGKPYKYVGLDPFNDNLCICLANQDDDPQCFSVDEIKKPESPQQREERERLEAAYDLYLAFWSASKSSIILESFKEFSWGGNSDLKHFLAIVDKTNYRKESNQ